MTHLEKLHRDYFKWLYDHVFRTWDLESPCSYTQVCDVMHQIPFSSLVPHDGNRAYDGAELRSVFLESHVHNMTLAEVGDFAYSNATIFEVLIALAIRAGLMNSMAEHAWFMQFMENLGLDEFHDLACSKKLRVTTGRIRRILQRFNERRYSPSGRGGLFPLRHPQRDQRNVELWYQLGAYINENAI